MGAGAYTPSLTGSAAGGSASAAGNASAARPSYGAYSANGAAIGAAQLRANGAAQSHSAYSQPANGLSRGGNASNGAVRAGQTDAAGGKPPDRVDGKEFFKLARSRLPYEQFHEFLQVCQNPLRISFPSGRHISVCMREKVHKCLH